MKRERGVCTCGGWVGGGARGGSGGWREWREVEREGGKERRRHVTGVKENDAHFLKAHHTLLFPM